MKLIFAFVSRNPWVFVVLAFLLLIGAWATLISIVVKNPQEQIEVEKHQIPRLEKTIPAD